MATLSLSSIIRSNSRFHQNYFHDSCESYGQMGNECGQTRDNVLYWVDNDGYINWSTGNYTSVVYRIQDTEMEYNRVNNGIYNVGLVRDTQDNIILMYMYGNGSGVRIIGRRYAKPAVGWAAWAASSPTSPTVSTLINFQWYNSQNDGNRHVWQFSGYHVAKVANITNGVLVITGGTSVNPQNQTNRGDLIGFSVNLTSGAVITSNTPVSGEYPMYSTYDSSYVYTNNNSYGAGLGSSMQVGPFSSTGFRIGWYTYAYSANMGNPYDQTNVYNQRNSNNLAPCYARWNVDANGVLTDEGWGVSSGTRYGPLRHVDMEGSSGNASIYTQTYTYGPVGQNTILVCTIFNGKPTLNYHNGYNPSTNNAWNWTYSTTPTNWVFTPRSAPTITWVSSTTLRMFASDGTNGAYMDITWDGTNFTFPATATAIPGWNVNAKGKAPFALMFNRYANFSRGNSSAEISATSLSTSYAWSGPIGTITEPYVPTLKANNGMKFQYVSSATNTNVMTDLWGTDQNYVPAPWSTFQFKRVSSGAGTEYYNYTTNAWTSSVVNNAAGLFPSGGGVAYPYSSTSQYTNDIQGTWADNTSYTYSYTFTDPNGQSVNTNTRTIATPAVSAAPTSPTPRRLFVFTLQNRTSSHILSVENRVLINKVNLVNQSANSVGVTLNLGGYNFLSTITLAPYQTAQYETAVIANVAERLLVTCTADASVDMWIMGTEGV